jgi:transposase
VLWERYVQLTEIEAVFRNLKTDLILRPIFHQTDARIEAHIFVAFLAYCLLATTDSSLSSGIDQPSGSGKDVGHPNG